ncbi:MAG: hypothetical protein ABWK01_00925 [Infirmifilum sp.]
MDRRMTVTGALKFEVPVFIFKLYAFGGTGLILVEQGHLRFIALNPEKTGLMEARFKTGYFEKWEGEAPGKYLAFAAGLDEIVSNVEVELKDGEVMIKGIKPYTMNAPDPPVVQVPLRKVDFKPPFFEPAGEITYAGFFENSYSELRKLKGLGNTYLIVKVQGETLTVSPPLRRFKLDSPAEMEFEVKVLARDFVRVIDVARGLFSTRHMLPVDSVFPTGPQGQHLGLRFHAPGDIYAVLAGQL